MFVYYAGHGLQANFTDIITNGGEKFRYPLECILRAIGKIKGAFVFSLFDCCRERVTDELLKKFRGLGAAADYDMGLLGVDDMLEETGPTRGAN